VAVVYLQPGMLASPQDPEGVPAPSLRRLKQRLDKPVSRPLEPSGPVQLRPVFKTRVTGRPFVPTLEEHLRETFELTDFQRKYADYAAMCCGLDLGALFGRIERAMDERTARKVHEEVTRELALIEAAQSKQVR
jgi:hypothetical protein